MLPPTDDRPSGPLFHLPMTGLTLAQYRIDAELGRGGMGIVYRATDTKLDRTVALKVLPPHALASADDRARFYREARAAARLNHPHIATIHQIDEAPLLAEGETPATDAEARPFIAMEFIDGESLAERIAKGPLKLDEVVRVASQVAEALVAAHEAGIVHRDIKSGNVMLTSKGEVKVLDFGLAKTAASTQLTRQGSTLGTIAYMSPEQARGEEVDRRTDLWALGVVLYEMIAGRLPFQADYEQATLYGILNEDPEPLTALRTGVPMEIEGVVFKLLRKEAKLRYQTASDLVADLTTVSLAHGSARSSRSHISVSTVGLRPAASGRRRRIDFVAGVLAGFVVLGFVWQLVSSGPVPEVEAPLRLAYNLSDNVPVLALALSPDGRTLAYASDLVHIVDLTTGTDRTVDGTQGVVMLDFSPDGGQLLLTKLESIVRVPVAGASPVTILEGLAEIEPRARWARDGWILYEAEGGIHRYNESRRENRVVMSIDSTAGEFDFDFPYLMPDGETVLATLEHSDGHKVVRFADFETGAIRVEVPFEADNLRFLSSGHLAGVLNGQLVVLPFDAERLEVLGERAVGGVVPDAKLYAVSEDGTLVYGSVGSDYGSRATKSVPALLTFGSTPEPLGLPQGAYYSVHLSPDQTRISYVENSIAENGIRDSRLNVYDLERGTSRQIAGGVGESFNGVVWMRGGDSLMYQKTTATDLTPDAYVRSAWGTGPERHLGSGGGFPIDLDLGPPGGGGVYVTRTGVESSLMVRFSPREMKPIAPAAGGVAMIRGPRFSPDGRSIAFVQDGIPMVIDADGANAPVVISRGTGRFVRWAESGAALFYVAENGALMRVPTVLDPAFSIAGPEREVARIDPSVPYLAVFNDGRRAIVGIDAEDGFLAQLSEKSNSLQFVLHWFSELSPKPR